MASRINKILGHLQPAQQQSAVASNPTAGNKPPINVTVTGAAGNICYSILFMIAQGNMLGPDQPINLTLLDIPQAEKAMEGVVMEINDCAFPLIASMKATSDYKEAFTGCQIALLVGAMPRKKGMDRKDLLKANAKIFVGQGQAIDKYADRNVKVCVVGNPANTNALITMKNAPSIPRENFTALTRLDQNRAASQLATRLGVPVAKINNPIIWGNHSKTQYPDVNFATVNDVPFPTNTTAIRKAVNNDEWLDGDFMKTVQSRGAAIIQARGKSSAASAAKSAVDHVRDWILGTEDGRVVSMGVISDGNPYGVAEDIIYSFPVKCEYGQWKIIGGLNIDDRSKKLMKITEDELLGEKKNALGQ